MADRKKILWGITDSEEKLFLSKMCDIADRSEIASKVMFSRFLNPKEQLMIKSRMGMDFSVNFFGGYSDAERAVAAFGDDEVSYPITALLIEAKGKRALTHRDYLGSVLSLGIKREHIGDILIKDSGAVMFVTDEISDFIVMNLSRIGNTPVKISVTENLSEFDTNHHFKETDVTVSSMRFDCVLSAVAGTSRTRSSELIDEGLCMVNYAVTKNSRLQIKDGDIISVRGFGKFVIQTDSRLTKKGRIHIKVKKYI